MDGDFYVDYSRLDSLQVAIIGDKFNSHMVVKGKAGTGKSLIALHKLGRVAPDKKAVLIVYTKSLKQYFKDGFQALGIDEKTVFHYQDWIPQEVDYIFDLSDEDLAGLQIFAKIIAGAIKRAFPCRKVAQVVLPILAENRTLNFMPHRLLPGWVFTMYRIIWPNGNIVCVPYVRYLQILIIPMCLFVVSSINPLCVMLQSSLTRVISRVFGFSPRLRVSVCGTGTLNISLRNFSWKHGFMGILFITLHGYSIRIFLYTPLCA